MQVEGRRLIEELGMQLLPGGFCLWGPTLLASDPLLGSPRTKNLPSDHQLLRNISRTAREYMASRIVLLGGLFGASADPEGDLPGLLVPWRSELLEVEIAWVYPKPAHQWDQILDFLEISRIASGAKLGDAELISPKSAFRAGKDLSFVGGQKPFIRSAAGKKVAAWAVKERALVFPSCGGSVSKSSEMPDWDWCQEVEPLLLPLLEVQPSDAESDLALEAAL